MTSTAPLSVSWLSPRRRHPAYAWAPAPVRPTVVAVQDPAGPIGVTVEAFLNSAWTDITASTVYYRDRVVISRGLADETSRVQPQTARLTLNNRDGRFSPRNPVGPYYGQIGRNTPLRVSRMQNGVRRYRFYGEVPSWPTTWDITGSDVYTPITAAGMMRRLSQGAAVLGSAMFRAFTVAGAGLPLVAYWPCQDGKNSTSIASGLPGGTPMALSGQAAPAFAQDTAFACSDPLPQLTASIWTGAVGAYTGGVDNVVTFLLSVPATGAFDTAVVCRVLTKGTVARLDVKYLGAGNGGLQMFGYDASGTQLFSSFLLGGVEININANPVYVVMQLSANGSGVDWYVAAFPLAVTGGGSTDFATLPSAVIGNVTAVVINPDGQLNDTAVGHVAVQHNAAVQLFPVAPAQDFSVDAVPLTAWQYEKSAARFIRLCAEQNVPAVFGSSILNTNFRMGKQFSDTFLNIIQEPVDTSAGILFEARDQLALVMRALGSLYNQAPHLTLDYAQHQLSAPPVPVDDDAFTRNDVTVQRIGGSAAVAQLATGPLSVKAPPAGVGDYQTGYQISAFDDTGLADQAGWRLHMGTVDEPRYPQISLNLRHPTFTGSVDMTNAAMTLDVGDRILITNPPAWLPPDPISLIVLGYTETLGVYEHDMVLNCAPESPYRVALADDAVLGRADTDGSTLSGDYSSSAAALLVATTNATSPLWTTSAPEFPFDVAVGGERMTVTNITGASSPQTFAVTRSVNGVFKSQTDKTDVRLWQPMILGL